MSVTGTAAQTRERGEWVEPREYPFRSVTGLVRWRFGAGRTAMTQQRAIDPGREGTGTRDPFHVEEMQARFARCVAVVAAAEDQGLLGLAYGGPCWSDARIAQYVGTSEAIVRRRRSAALRQVKAAACEAGMIPPEGS